MKVIINAVGITPAGTIKSGWISHSATIEKAKNRIAQWSSQIANGSYKDWSGGPRSQWVKDMIDADYKIAFYTYLMLDEGMTYVDYKSNNIEDKIIHILKNRSTLAEEELDELWDEVEKIYAETNHIDKEGLSQLIERVEKKIA